jgi:hypothetical protein
MTMPTKCELFVLVSSPLSFDKASLYFSVYICLPEFVDTVLQYPISGLEKTLQWVDVLQDK